MLYESLRTYIVYADLVGDSSPYEIRFPTWIPRGFGRLLWGIFRIHASKIHYQDSLTWESSIVCGASYHVWICLLSSSVMMWRKIRVTVCHRLHQRRAILANRDIQRDTFPPIYHGLWHSPPRMKLSAVKLREKKTFIGKKICRIILGGHIWRCKDSITINQA